MPQNIFFYELAIFWSAKKQRIDFHKTHRTEIRFVIGLENRLLNWEMEISF